MILWNIAPNAELVKGVQPAFEQLLDSEIQVVEAGLNFGSKDQRFQTSVEKGDASARYTCDQCKCSIFNLFWAFQRTTGARQEHCNSCILSDTDTKQNANFDSTSDIEKVELRCTLCDFGESKSLLEFSKSYLDATKTSVQPDQGVNKIGDAETADNEDDGAMDLSEESL